MPPSICKYLSQTDKKASGTTGDCCFFVPSRYTLRSYRRRCRHMQLPSFLVVSYCRSHPCPRRLPSPHVIHLKWPGNEIGPQKDTNGTVMEREPTYKVILSYKQPLEALLPLQYILQRRLQVCCFNRILTQEEETLLKVITGSQTKKCISYCRLHPLSSGKDAITIF